MRALFVLAVILAVVAQARTGPTWRDLETYTFDKFCRDFGRRYTNTAEHNERKSVFLSNLQEAIRHNADSTKSWKKGVNEFSDWTDAEFNDFNKLKVDPNRHSRKQVRKNSKPMQGFGSSETPTLPEKVDYRTWTSPRVLTAVKNQGTCGGCWGFASMASIESFYALKTGELPVLSVQQPISCDDTNSGCGGGTMTNVWNYATANAINTEWQYPFGDFFVANSSKEATSKCENITKKWSIPQRSGYSSLPKARLTGFEMVAENDAEAALTALARAGPLAIVVAANPWKSYEGGILQNDDKLDNKTLYGINHGVQLVGYGHDDESGLDYWIVRNSWGASWGEAGFIRLSRPKKEPCGVYLKQGSWQVCGTSGLLLAPDYPFVTTKIDPTEKEE